MTSDKQLLEEMGFDPEIIRRALKATNNAGLQPALDWIEKHQYDPPEDDESQARTLGGSPGSAEDAHVKEEKPQVQLTEEERQKKLEELQEKMAQRRLEREKEEAEQRRQNEKIRRQAGKELIEAKEKLQEKEMQDLLQQRKREKQEEKLARERVKKQIEQDRLDRLARQKEGSAPQQVQQKPASQPQPPQNVNYDEARIQVRAKGRVLAFNFSSAEKLGVLLEKLQAEGLSGTLTQTYPRKAFGDADFGKSFKELGLVPSAALMLS